MVRCKICGNKTTEKHKNLFDDRYGYPGKFSVYECNNCGFMQTYPQLNYAEILKIYSLYYPRRKIDKEDILKTKDVFLNKKKIKRRDLGIYRHLKIKVGNRILDIGSGTGESLLRIESLGGEAWGVDPDGNAKRVADSLEFKFHHGFLYDCPFPKKYFDFITLSQVLEHEPDPLKLINECKKYLKPNGKIILSVPNTDALFRKVFGKRWIHWHVPYHLNHFDNKSMRLLAKKTGLKIKSIETITPNLWTFLQILSLMIKVEEGKKSLIWLESKNKKNINKNNRRVWEIKQFCNKIGEIVMNTFFFNRILDKLGMGESLIVTLV